MASIVTDRLDGLNSATAIKGPCRVATTANITLSGLQTVDGVSLAADDRVLVKNQASSVDNGIYIVSTGLWRRSKDFAGNRDVKKGTQVFVTSGTTYAETIWYVTTADPITIDTSAITFASSGTVVSVYPHIASVALLEALDTATNTLVYLSASGKEGLFKRVTAASYTSWIAADTTNAIIVQSTTNATYAWLRVDIDRLDIRWFGGVADGTDSLDAGSPTTVRGAWVTATAYALHDLVWSGGLGYRCISAHTSGTFATDLAAAKWVLGAFSGTDNLAALRAMVAVYEATGIPMRPSSGNYRLVMPGGTASQTGYATLTGQTFDIEGQGEVWFFLDEDGTGGGYNLWKTDTVATSYTARRSFREHNIRVRGRWSHKPGGNTGSPDGSRAHVHYISGYTDVSIKNNVFEDIAGSVNRITTCHNVVAENNRIARVGKGGLRFQDCYNIKVHGNHIEHVDDDTIDCHSSANSIRSNVSIVGNTLFACEGVVALGAVNLTFMGNTLDYCHGGVYLGGRVSAEGDNAPLNIVCVGNTIRNDISRSTDGSTLATNTGGAIMISGVPASILAGDYNGSSAVIDPIVLDLYKNIDLDTTSVPQGGNVIVSGNVIKRTRPAVATYSLWGIGRFFYADGWINPAVGEANFAAHGIVINSDVDNFVVSDNAVSGCRAGAGVYLVYLSSGDDRHWAFLNGSVSGNVIRDCHEGVKASISYGAAATIRIGVDINGNLFDLDPYCISAARTDATSGRWNSAAAVTDKNYGISLGNCQGYSVRGNTFKNLWEPIYNDATRVLAHYSGNLVICQPTTGGHAYVAANAGVGTPGRAGGGFAHMIEDCTPTSATFGQMLNACPTEATAVPASGWGVEGHFIRNSDPSIDANNMVILGWVRLLTSNAWVSGTDYAILRASTVSPAT
jgi:hypothetical protein